LLPSLLGLGLGAGCSEGPSSTDSLGSGEVVGSSSLPISVGEFEDNGTAELADAIKALDSGSGAIIPKTDVDYWHVVARPGDRVFAAGHVLASLNSFDTELSVYTNLDTSTPVATDDDSGYSISAAVAGVAVPQGASTVFLRLWEHNYDQTIDSYMLYAYAANPSYAHVEPANENNGALNAAEAISAPLVRAQINAANDVDYFSFAAPANAAIIAIADVDPDANGKVNLKLSLRDANDVELTYGKNDASPSGTNAEATGVAQTGADGTYYLRVEGPATGKYDVVVLVKGRPVVPPGALPELADNGSAATAMACKDQHPGMASIELPGDRDYWKVGHKTGDRLFAYADTSQTTGSANVVLQYRHATDVLGKQDDGSGPGSSAALATKASGTYGFLRVSESGDDETIGDYHLFAVAVNPADEMVDVEVNDAIANSKPIGATMVLGKFPTAGDVDYWSFKARAGDTVVTIVDDDPNLGPVVDTDIEIRDANDKVLATGDNNFGAKANAAGPVLIPATGTYHVRVAEGGGNLGEYRLVVLVSKGPIACGDADLDGNEGCDDGNVANLDGCNEACAVEKGWSCAAQPSKCAAICGDGLVLGGEACDDNNKTDGDGCSKGCAIETGFKCTGAPSTCTAICGDGKVLAGEACDDGNVKDGDGCSKSCAQESGFKCNGAPSSCAASCGDGMVLGGEACDDNNTVDGDGCSKTCNTEEGFKCNGAPSKCLPVCGDGKLVGGEACDDDNLTEGDGCSKTCTVEEGWKCTGTTSNCAPVCGDGKVVGLEACDDGNTKDGDGCSASCAIESGYGCAMGACKPVCGDGKITGGEACDDDNVIDGDGCSKNCALEEGFNCSGAPTLCTATCGDGKVVGKEACDDGNTNDDDGCTAKCEKVKVVTVAAAGGGEAKSGCSVSTGGRDRGGYALALVIGALALVQRRRREVVSKRSGRVVGYAR
jgi:MYXO-CTERM domain-containing protein